MRLQRRVAVAGLWIALAMGVAACGSSTSPPQNPQVLLGQAKQAIDSAPSLHLLLTSKDVGGGGTVVTGGNGDASRPNNFQGTVQLTINGIPATIGVVSTGGTFYVRAPFAPRFAPANPATYGLADPGTLLDPQTGLSSLLVGATNVRSAPTVRFGGEQLDQVDATISGARLGQIVPGTDPSQSFQATLGIAEGSHQLRRVILSGPSFSSYTLVLDNYGEHVVITPPA